MLYISFKKIAHQFIKVIFILMSFVSNCWSTQQFDKLWSLFTLTGNYGDFFYYAEPQFRLVYADNVFQQFLANMGGGFPLTKEWQVWAGQTFSADSQDTVPGNLDEYRSWQQLLWTHPIQRDLLISRTRVEERVSLYFSPIAVRLRERLIYKTPLTHNMSMVISDEFFFNLNQTHWVITKTFDQNRAYIGVEQRLTAVLSLGAGYMNQYLSLPTSQSNQVLVISVMANLAT